MKESCQGFQFWQAWCHGKWVIPRFPYKAEIGFVSTGKANVYGDFFSWFLLLVSL